MAKKILIADDEIDILKVVTFRLRKSGYEILTAVNGKEALDLIQVKRPDLILLDLRMPLMDGYEVCKRIKHDEELKKIPVILLTASKINEAPEKVRELEADDYLIKPFDPAKLFEKVKKFIG
jgi:CheY-like chemotaxis protein